LEVGLDEFVQPRLGRGGAEGSDVVGGGRRGPLSEGAGGVRLPIVAGVSEIRPDPDATASRVNRTRHHC
jgi:hypothetical protein